MGCKCAIKSELPFLQFAMLEIVLRSEGITSLNSGQTSSIAFMFHSPYSSPYPDVLENGHYRLCNLVPLIAMPFPQCQAPNSN